MIRCIFIPLSFNFLILWISLEINIIRFFIILNKNSINLSNNFIVKYFRIQRILSLFLLITILNKFYLIFFLIILIKIGFPPFHFWIIDLVLNIKEIQFLYLSFFQKYPLILILFFWFYTNNNFFYFFLMFNIFLTRILIFFSSSIIYFLFFSSFNFIFWLYLLINFNLFYFKIWILRYFIIFFLIILKISKIEKIENILSIKIINFSYIFFWFSGFPPFLIFFIKLIVFIFFIKLSLNFVIFLIIISFFYLFIYFQIFYSLFVVYIKKFELIKNNFKTILFIFWIWTIFI